MSRTVTAPRWGMRAALAGAFALALTAFAAIGLVAQANAAFTTPQCGGTNVLGRGASFAQAAHGTWVDGFGTFFCPGSAPGIAYEPLGSGAGRTAMTLRGPEDPRFGGTDDALTTAQKATINAGDPDVEGDEGQIHQIPAAVGAVAVLVNFPDGCDPANLEADRRTDEIEPGSANHLTRVRFSKDELEKVFAKEAGYDFWDDLFPELEEPGCEGKPIIRVVRFDHSGTTFAFKDFLGRENPGRGWTTSLQTGTNGNREWPEATFGSGGQCDGTAAPGNQPDNVDHLTSSCAAGAENLVAKLNTVDGGIGYADIASARPHFAVSPFTSDPPDKFWTQVENGSDEWAEPTEAANGFLTNGTKGSNCVVTEFVNVGDSTLGDWAETSGVDSPVGYGICTLTYGMLFDDHAETYGISPIEEARARTVKDYWSFIVSDAGQFLLKSNDYSPLPEGILATARTGLAQIDWNKGAGGGAPGGGEGGGTPPPAGDGGASTVPPPVAKPSNRFSLPRRTINRKTGKATVSVKIPGAGRVLLVGTARIGKRTIQVGRVVLNANKAGAYNLNLNPSRPALNRLRQKGTLRVALRVTFTPRGGDANATNSAVVLKLDKPKRGKRR